MTKRKKPKKPKPKKPMQSDLKKINSGQLKVTVDLNAQDLEGYIKKSQNMLGTDLEVKGFRKGKAPKDLIEKHLDPSKVRNLALEMAVEGSLSIVIKKNSLDVLNTSRLTVEKNDPNQLVFSVVVDLFPEVKTPDLKQIKVQRKVITVEEKEVDDALEIVKNSRSQFIDKDSNGTAAKSDRVEVDFEVKKDGQITEGGVSKNHPLIIGGASFIPGFEDQLIGMKKGESKSFSLTAPDGYFHKEVAGKKLDFNVKLVDIKKVIKPQLTDEFARSLGEFSDLAELINSVKEGLTEEKRVKESQRVRLDILDNIISRSSIEVPADLLEKQLGIMVSDFDSSLHEKGFELGLYLAKIGKSQEELEKEWKKDAERQVKISLVIRKLSKDLSLEATDEEVQEAVGQFVQSAIARGELNQQEVDLAKLKENVSLKITNEKTLSYIESHCAV